ncbi:putative membrane protein [Clostridium bornimense]|uniref:Putative membrane protein n=1 Tax=Clostridium bornimense TaxID=1216932 RepID=W6RZJ3_9CLOT|nr:hypothetical protein [Clostridium bornimense]CDM69034.1 putative membrane protein [Clostridium bornimense]
MGVNRYNFMRYKGNDINSEEIDRDGIDIENSEDKEGSTSSNSDISYPDSELIRQLGVLNLSINTIYIIVLAIFMNINYLYDSRGRLLDEINGTNYMENAPDFSDAPRIANKLFLYATGVFLEINFEELQVVSSMTGEDRDEKAIRNANNNLLSSLLIFIATGISHDTLNF